MKQLRVLPLPSGWDASPSQVTPSSISPVPILYTCVERDNTMAGTGCRTTDLQIRSPTGLPLHHRAPSRMNTEVGNWRENKLVLTTDSLVEENSLLRTLCYYGKELMPQRKVQKINQEKNFLLQNTQLLKGGHLDHSVQLIASKLIGKVCIRHVHIFHPQSRINRWIIPLKLCL